MKKNYCILLFAFSPFWLTAQGPEVKDPFLSPTSLSCEELEQQLLFKFNRWRYQGLVKIVKSSANNMSIAWLTDQNRWLQVSEASISTESSFMPWQLQTISAQSVTWQLALPNYCYKQLIFTMVFAGGISE